MVIFINGSFGVGKTTAARILKRRIAGSAIIDPELPGIPLLAMRRFWPFGKAIDDFQDIPLWRWTGIRIILLARRLQKVVIVPMTFSNASCLQEFLQAVRARDEATFHYCLTSSHGVVLARLKSREGARGPSRWQLRRSAECCAAHQAPEFAEQIPTQGRSAREVADDIVSRIRSHQRPAGAAS